MRGHLTPTGVFSVIQKQKWHRSNIYSNAPMPYMQRITWSGVALHAGVLPGYPASHGCIRMPYGFAKELWALTKVGARVIITRHEVAPFAISDAHLFAPAPPPADPPPVAEEKSPAASSMPEMKISENAPATTGMAVAAVDVARPIETAAVVTISPAVEQPADNDPPPLPRPRIVPLDKSPISIFISRKANRLFVRRHFKPLFDAPVDIKAPDQPLGTHVFTAMELTDNGKSMRWVAISMPPERPKPQKHQRSRTGSHRNHDEPPVATIEAVPAPSADEALARIDVPNDVRERISALLRPGSSLIISDHGLGAETGPNDTDFIVLTR